MRRRILSRANDLTGHTCAGCGLPIHGAATVISDSAGGRTYYHRGHRLSDWKILEEDLREFLRTGTPEAPRPASCNNLPNRKET